MRDEINENAKQITQKNNIEIEFVRKNNFRKENRVKILFYPNFNDACSFFWRIAKNEIH